MKKPVDPRKSIPAPRKFLSKLNGTSAVCNGELTVNHILNSIKSLPDNLDLNSVYVEVSQKTIWTNNGSDTPNLSGDAFGKFVAGDIKRWAAVAKASGAKLD